MKVLDVGCGIGGPARTIAKFIGCEIVGLTISQGQVDRAIFLTELEGLSHKCTFVQGDYLDMPFEDASFDAAYAIEATVHAPSLLQVYNEIARVLKPGAPVGLSEWLLTPKFDPKNGKHIGIRNRIERGNGLNNLHTSDQAREAFVLAGFEINHEEDFACHFDYVKDFMRAKSAATATLQGDNPVNEAQSYSSIPVPFKSGLTTAPGPSKPFPSPLPIPITVYRPWSFPLEGDYGLATTWTDWWLCWKMSPTARRLGLVFVHVGEKLGFVKKGVPDAMKTMAFCVDSGVEGGKEGIFSPCWWFIGRKAVSIARGEGARVGNAKDKSGRGDFQEAIGMV
jgi:hypothetical protein